MILNDVTFRGCGCKKKKPVVKPTTSSAGK
jgi:hypothetical protein